MDRPKRKIVVAPSLLAKSQKTYTGSGPYAIFVLDDGTEFAIVHNGDHISIRNNGRTETTALVVEPVVSNHIVLRAK